MEERKYIYYALWVTPKEGPADFNGNPTPEVSFLEISLNRPPMKFSADFKGTPLGDMRVWLYEKEEKVEALEALGTLLGLGYAYPAACLGVLSSPVPYRRDLDG